MSDRVEEPLLVLGNGTGRDVVVHYGSGSISPDLSKTNRAALRDGQTIIITGLHPSCEGCVSFMAVDIDDLGVDVFSLEFDSRCGYMMRRAAGHFSVRADHKLVAATGPPVLSMHTLMTRRVSLDPWHYLVSLVILRSPSGDACEMLRSWMVSSETSEPERSEASPGAGPGGTSTSSASP